MKLLINGKNYEINENEYTQIFHNEYHFLKLYNEIDLHERIIGLIHKITQHFSCTDFFSFETTHGGFIPINLENNFKNLHLVRTHHTNIINIEYNIQNLISINNREKIKLHDNFVLNANSSNSIFFNIKQDDFDIYKSNQDIFITTNKLDFCNFNKYLLKGTEYFIYISDDINLKFKETFKYYIEDNYFLNFDNLINLCIMVKNGGEQFEQMLIDNLQIIDKWTILDTGSTDETLNIIKRVLVGKKEGNLYEEPFINFKDSRNRLLDLAGNDCKYILTLDDTYRIKGDLRYFLNEVRSDQYSDSFSLFIQSDDTKYGSNRIIKTNSGLRYIYKIHEVISDKNNINIVIPETKTFILDERFDYMEKRTMERKKLDLELLMEEYEENPNNPRTYYYLAQTYNLLEDFDKAFYYFIKRCEFINSGFLQERVDAAFEAARIANFKLNKPWNECEELYNKAFKIDESRPESLYFIGIHYYLENNFTLAYKFMKSAFEKGFPKHCQYSLKPTISFHFLPKFLAKICYHLEDFELGEKAAEFFIINNKDNAEDYEEILSWHKIYQKLNIYKGPKNPTVPKKPILCFVADGGFNCWTGSTILNKGVGGSETHVIEMAKHIKRHNFFDVFVFCNTPGENDEEFEGVIYKHLNKYYEFINNNYIHTSIISRYSEYLPVTYKGFTENVYLIVHDLTPSGVIIPFDTKLKNIFCLTEWHTEYLLKIFPTIKDIIVPLYYGIDNTLFPDISYDNDLSYKEKYKFIYSSFPNRGLLELLQMWNEIHNIQPNATLHIYSNIENEWSNNVEPDKMQKIKELLYYYLNRDVGVHYHGWVSKPELAEAWKTSQFWFYPCTFRETFCLTALEAAKTKTLAITNNLAALENTVGDRGIIIKGDPTTKEWQQNALQTIKELLTNQSNTYTEAIEKNYNWASQLTWEGQANKLLNEYVLKHTFEYKGMYNWTNDLPQNSKQIFLDIIEHFKLNSLKIKNGENITILEIGTYTGISLINLVKNIPNSIGYGLDRWENYQENKLLTQIQNLGVEKSFYSNINSEKLSHRIFGIKGTSTDKLVEFLKNNQKFDFIYVDGSHLLLDCYFDLIISWNILEIGGILAIDDYLYKKDDNMLDSPYEAVNHFLQLFYGKYKILNINYRVFLEKI